MDLATHVSIDRQCQFAIAELDALLTDWKKRHGDLLGPVSYGGGDGLPAMVSAHYNGRTFRHIEGLSALMALDPWPESFD